MKFCLLQSGITVQSPLDWEFIMLFLSRLAEKPPEPMIANGRALHEELKILSICYIFP